MNKSTTLRNLMLDLCDVSETSNALAYFSKLFQASVNKEITMEQWCLLNGDFHLHCKKNKIEIRNQQG
jgi:hypothetical protein